MNTAFDKVILKIGPDSLVVRLEDLPQRMRYDFEGTGCCLRTVMQYAFPSEAYHLQDDFNVPLLSVTARPSIGYMPRHDAARAEGAD